VSQLGLPEDNVEPLVAQFLGVEFLPDEFLPPHPIPGSLAVRMNATNQHTGASSTLTKSETKQKPVKQYSDAPTV
jgi:hypothetical protein